MKLSFVISYDFYFLDEPAAVDGDGDVEEMDCEERWGDDGEVSMDFDLSEVQQEQLIAEISATRNTILPATSLDSFSLPSASPSTPLYQVSSSNGLQFRHCINGFMLKG